ncbi:efflux RND transporter periplasmic adaptor subunit [Azospirillum thermophilum]|uniref:Hemolysin secretion protein D n=1 Tax=Azospirillum thermophilum TaxID=2202148 RepID=A0A2S2CX90_9PROT|nr:HlyD family efflux transporter periplasmic adaptor subunit [Azospirillum thermophilum]AWK89133.1 hemolysin secretion protein D [Azospirillum thermophilum]
MNPVLLYRIVDAAALLLLLLLLSGCGDETAAEAVVTRPVTNPAAISRCRIDVEGGVIRLAAQREGLIQEVAVEEGDRVAGDQPLARIDSRQAELRAAVAEAELEQARAVVVTERHRVAAAERELLRRRGSGEAVSRRQLDEAETELAVRRSQLAAAEVAVTLAERRLAESRFEVEVRTIRAPVSGTIVRRRARPGDGVTVQTVTELFQLLPDSPRIARCTMEEMFLRNLSVGQTARVVLESDEAVGFPARVKRIGAVFGVPPASEDPTAKVDIRTVEVVLSLPPDAELRIGQRVRAYVVAGPSPMAGRDGGSAMLR